MCIVEGPAESVVSKISTSKLAFPGMLCSVVGLKVVRLLSLCL